jgi:hypothetical protein
VCVCIHTRVGYLYVNIDGNININTHTHTHTHKLRIKYKESKGQRKKALRIVPRGVCVCGGGCMYLLLQKKTKILHLCTSNAYVKALVRLFSGSFKDL